MKIQIVCPSLASSKYKSFMDFLMRFFYLELGEVFAAKLCEAFSKKQIFKSYGRIIF